MHGAPLRRPPLRPLDRRVAMIATKVPSEPLSMLQETLLACLNQTYPYPFDGERSRGSAPSAGGFRAPLPSPATYSRPSCSVAG